MEPEGDGFRVKLVLRSASGREAGTSTAAADRLFRAVAAAVDGLADQGVVPRVKAIDADLASWVGTQDPSAAAALADMELSYQYDMHAPEVPECDRLDQVAGLLGSAYAGYRSLCDGVRKGGGQMPELPVDHSSPQALVADRDARPPGFGSVADPGALADESRRALEHATTPEAKALLTAVLAEAQFAAGDVGGSQMAALQAARESPHDFLAWQKVAR